MLRKLIIIIFLGLIIGVAIGPLFYFHNLLVLIWLLVGLLAVVLIFYRYSFYIVLLALLVGSITLGSFRFNMTTYKPVNDISNYADQEISIKGIIIDDPQEVDELIKFTVLVESLDDEIQATGKILITTRRYPLYYYGNVVSVKGYLKMPGQSADFDYSAYLSRFGVYSVMNYPDINLIESFRANHFLSFLYRLKHLFITSINQVLSEPAASFLSGLILGIRSSLPTDLLESFNITGLTHIIALSGFNITIIAGALMSMLRFFPMNIRFGSSVIIIVAFVLLTGASPSVTRAAIMGILILLAGLTGRLHDITISLLLTAVVMILINPRILHYDVGFQLSFLATVGIIYFNPLLQGLLYRVPEFIRMYLGPTLSALLMVIPVIVYNFGRISLIAPLANVMVLPLIPITMGLGFLATITGLIHTGIGLIVGAIAWLPLMAMVLVARYLSKVPLASFEIQIGGVWWIAVYYLILVFLVIYQYRRVRATENLSMGARLTRSG